MQLNHEHVAAEHIPTAMDAGDLGHGSKQLESGQRSDTAN